MSAPKLPVGQESLQIQQQFNAIGVAQVIVVLRSQSTFALAAAASPVARLRKYFVSSDLSVDSAILAAAASPTGKRGMIGARAPAPPVVRMYPNLGVLLGTVTPDGLSQLRRDGEVAGVAGAPPFSLIRPRQVSEATTEPPVTWGINALEVPRLWKQGLTGSGVVVAHLDTGADGKHPALNGVFSDFAEFDFLGSPVSPAPAPHDTAEHGTHTAATIVGQTVKGGVRLGVAPDAKLASAIVIEGGNVVARVLAGLDWALGRHAKVLSLSLGLPGYWRDFVPIVQILRTRGVLPVIAVGNESPGTSRSPGNYSEALSVGASNRLGGVALFSSSQRFS